MLLKPATRKLTVTANNVDKYLGVKRFRFGSADEKDQVGQVTGLAWTEVGGELLTIESAVVDGKGKFIQTGQLGDVMKESAQIALSYIKAHSEDLDLASATDRRFHVHVPAGAVPKDGPSAGVTMATALVSLLTNRNVKENVGMTGELTLAGKVLPIGGVKQKVLAAHRAGLDTVIIPARNADDLDDVPDEVREQMTFHTAEDISEVIDAALV